MSSYIHTFYNLNLCVCFVLWSVYNSVRICISSLFFFSWFVNLELRISSFDRLYRSERSSSSSLSLNVVFSPCQIANDVKNLVFCSTWQRERERAWALQLQMKWMTIFRARAFTVWLQNLCILFVVRMLESSCCQIFSFCSSLSLCLFVYG